MEVGVVVGPREMELVEDVGLLSDDGELRVFAEPFDLVGGVVAGSRREVATKVEIFVFTRVFMVVEEVDGLAVADGPCGR